MSMTQRYAGLQPYEPRCLECDGALTPEQHADSVFEVKGPFGRQRLEGPFHHECLTKRQAREKAKQQ